MLEGGILAVPGLRNRAKMLARNAFMAFYGAFSDKLRN